MFDFDTGPYERCPSELTSENSAECNFELISGVTISNPNPAETVRPHASDKYDTGGVLGEVSIPPALWASRFRLDFESEDVREVRIKLLRNRVTIGSNAQNMFIFNDTLRMIVNQGLPDQTFAEALVDADNSWVVVAALKATSIRSLDMEWVGENVGDEYDGLTQRIFMLQIDAYSGAIRVANFVVCQWHRVSPVQYNNASTVEHLPFDTCNDSCGKPLLSNLIVLPGRK